MGAFFYVESIGCFVSLISYAVTEMIEKKNLNTKKMVLQKTLYLTEYHLFCNELRVLLSFFNANKISKKFIVPAVTIREIYGREVVPFYRVDSLMAYKVLEANSSTVSCILLHM